MEEPDQIIFFIFIHEPAVDPHLPAEAIPFSLLWLWSLQPNHSREINWQRYALPPTTTNDIALHSTPRSKEGEH